MTKRILLAAMWLAVALTAPAWAAEQKSKPETSYFAIYLQGSKLGYQKTVRTVADGQVTTATTMFVSMNRMGMTVEVTALETDVETAEGKPRRFEMTQKMSGMNMVTSGVIDADGQMTITSGTGGLSELNKGEKKTYPAGALMSEGQRLLQIKKGLKAGTKYEYQAFNPETQKADRMEVAVGEKETIDLFGRKVEATRITVIAHQPSGDLTTTEWVDADCDTLQSEMTLLGMPMVIKECDEAFAKSPAKDPVDFFTALLLTSPRPLPDETKKMTLTVKSKTGKKLAILATDTQKVKTNEDGTVTITVEQLALPKGQARPYDGKEQAALDALKPTRYVQSDDALIVKKAEQIVGSSKDAAEAALKLAAWVHGNMDKKDFDVGYASASEVIRNHEGDCTEFSVLLTALCRAAGIPARTADGYLYADEFMGHKNIFGGHQWTQVYIGGKWIDLDATLGSPHNSARRITLAVGDGSADDLAGMVNAMGTFTIVKAAGE